MAAVIDSLFVSIGLDTQDLEQGLHGVSARLSGSAKALGSETAAAAAPAAEALKKLSGGAQLAAPAVGRAAGMLRELASALAAPVLAAFAGASAGAAVSAFADEAQGLKQLSDSLGMSMEDLQGWQYAAEAAGAEASEVGNFFRDMSDYITDAVTFDSGPMKDIAEKLGIALKNVRGNMRGAAEVSLELADAFSRIDKQRAVGFGMQLGLDPAIIGLLQKGRGEIEGLIKAQAELGGYTKEDADMAGRARFAFLALTRAMQASAVPLARVLVPVMTRFAEELSRAAAFLRRHETFAKAAFAGIAAVITRLLLPASVELAAVWLANPITWIAAAIAAAIAAIALAVDDLSAYMQGGQAALSRFWAIFGTGPEIAKALARAFAELKEIGSSLFSALSGGVKLFFQNFSGVFSGLAQTAAGVLKTIKGLFQADFDQIAAGIAEVFSGLAETILGIFGGIAQTVSQAFWGVVDAVGRWFREMLASIPYLGWALSKMGVIDSPEAAASGAAGTLTPSSADSGGIAARAAGAAAATVSASATTNFRDVNIYASGTDAGAHIQKGVMDIFEKSGRSQAQQIARAAQTGVVQK